jgi:hypothetical protein
VSSSGRFLKLKIVFSKAGAFEKTAWRMKGGREVFWGRGKEVGRGRAERGVAGKSIL